MIQLDANKYPLPEECVIENIRYRIFDLPGFERLNKIVHDYLIYSDAIIFIVDSADRKSFHIAKEVLNELLLSEEYKSIPFLILGNKIDIPNSASEEELRYHLGLENYQKNNDSKLNYNTRPIGLFMCSVRMRSGYAEGFKWINQYL